jgi:hypothetical protein
MDGGAGMLTMDNAFFSLHFSPLALTVRGLHNAFLPATRADLL